MEEYLQGKRGEEKIFVDNTGKVLSTISKKNSAAGNDVYLTIDSKLQKAVYTMLEKRIAAILLSEIVNYDVDEDAQTDDDLHYISVKKVYSQLVTNNVVSLKSLSRKNATANEKSLNVKYKKAVDEAAVSYTHLDVYKRQKESRHDIIQAIEFGNPDCVIAFCKGIQAAAPVDSYLTPEPWDMPGYDAPVIMAAGAFVSGSSIELSADGPMKPPYACLLYTSRCV